MTVSRALCDRTGDPLFVDEHLPQPAGGHDVTKPTALADQDGAALEAVLLRHTSLFRIELVREQLLGERRNVESLFCGCWSGLVRAVVADVPDSVDPAPHVSLTVASPGPLS
ncbi:hypothetical protein [Nocardioides soli]|uniref:Uncharacterized protein n=1 Tax=Nocardioides soli TaxID=1036020 RepID=A0A7W4W173_9ACTN|nr:hypothetical protein [Nocardioides soli]MBB3045581.1 hypothetical protein [Nocardioides soli]